MLTAPPAIAAAPPPQAAGWRRQVARRLATLWIPKMLGSSLGTALFFVAYFGVMRHPLAPVRTMPLVGLDHWVDFRPEAFAAYVSLWVYVVIGPALARDRRELAACGIAALGLALAGLGIFLALPTQVPEFPIDWAQHPTLRFLKSTDVSGNACPSLHVAFAVFTAAVVHRALRAVRGPWALRAVNLLWCLAIVHSTLATRQHVAWDVAAGAALALAAVGLHGWLLRDRAMPAPRAPRRGPRPVRRPRASRPAPAPGRG